MRIIERLVTTMDSAALPGAEEVHVWRFPLSPRSHHWDVLNAAERDRANRYSLEKPRTQFIAARGFLREVIACYLNRSPHDVAFLVEPDGKPTLADSTLHFNLTHSAEWGLIAIANQRVGIDLEQVRPMENAGSLVERFFGPAERMEYAQLVERVRLAGFFRGWTCKEALLKAVGTGIHQVDRCEVLLNPERAPTVIRFPHPPRNGSWQLATWEPHAGYCAALATESPTPLSAPTQ